MWSLYRRRITEKETIIKELKEKLESLNNKIEEFLVTKKESKIVKENYVIVNDELKEKTNSINTYADVVKTSENKKQVNMFSNLNSGNKLQQLIENRKKKLMVTSLKY